VPDEERGTVKRGTAAAQEESFVLRRLYRPPRATTDWKPDYDEHEAGWWELFVDLTLVVAWSGATDALYESDGSLQALLYFFLAVNTIQCGWLLQMLYSTRFDHAEESLAYSAELFLFILGLAGMAIHVDEAECVKQFTACMLLQRLSLLFMYGSATKALKRRQQHMGIITAILAVAVALCTAVVLTQPEAFTPFVTVAWFLIIALEMPADIYANKIVPKADFIPVNIDHLVERQGAFIMICLGESLLSAMINYGSLPEAARNMEFYLTLSIVLLLSFSIGHLHYGIAPSREASAYRNEQWRGYTVYFATCALATSILLIGVGVKHCMHAVVYNSGVMSPENTWLLCTNVSLTLLLILILRVGHYWGKQPTPVDSPKGRRIKYVWWATVAAWPVVPLVIAAANVRQPEVSALWTLGLCAGACALMVVVETVCTNLLADIEFLEGMDELDDSVSKPGSGSE
jgi:low temperature requirement protein LtrA